MTTWSREKAAPISSLWQGETAVGDRGVFFATIREAGGVPVRFLAGNSTEVITVATFSNSNARPSDFLGTSRGLFFTVYTPETGRELWFSDGTPEGTRMVCDIHPGTEDSLICNISNIDGWNGRIVFGADDGLHGTEL